MATIERSMAKLAGALTLVLLVGCGGGTQPEMEPAPEPETQQPTESPDADAAAEREARERRAAEEEARRREAARERVLSVLRERVHFDFDRAEIRPDAEEVLQRKVAVLREYSGIRIRIEGHCDERGSNEYNLALGQRRAEAIRRYLLSYGLEPGRFETISYGEERPLVDEQNEEAWAMNRRGEFVSLDLGQLEADD